MTEPHEPAAEDLGRSYQHLLRQEAWQLDVPEPVEAAGNDPPTGPAREGEAPGEGKAPAEPAEAGPRRPRAPKDPPPPPLRIIEAMLFVGGRPLTAERAAEAIRGLTPAQFAEVVDALNKAYREQGRPYLVQKQDEGWVLSLRPSYRPILTRLYGQAKEARLSPAAVEVLAVVAYRQPVTRQEVESLRGRESGAILRQLVRRGLIAVTSRAESGGRDVQYGTTPRFLELFGLTSRDDLPETEDLQRL
jgi:segregation and condensation protein B